MKTKIVDNIVDSSSKFDITTLAPEEQELLFTEIRNMKVGLDKAKLDQEKTDDLLQMIFALVFLISYVLLIVAMLVLLFNLSSTNTSVNLPEWAVAFLSTIFGAMSTKVSTITDFIFGGSKSADIRDRNTKN
ncbi:MAG: hypothetical protein SNI70_03055 [Rikenellaceae bacterium]